MHPARPIPVLARLALAIQLCATSIAGAADEPPVERPFQDVLAGLLTDFETEMKAGKVEGLPDLAIREIQTSEEIPESYLAQLEAQVQERLNRSSRQRTVKCVACRARRTEIIKGKVVIYSPATQPAERARIAKQARIRHFLDVHLTLQRRTMLLSLAISDAETGRQIWVRTYHSEQDRLAPTTPSDGIKRVMQYRPTVQYRMTLFSMFQPDPAGLAHCLGLGFRMMERYDNRRKEIGFELDYFKDAGTLTGSVTEASNLYGAFNLSLLFLHAWNFIGDEENLNRPRVGALLGVGGTFASSFVGVLFRGTLEFRMGAHAALGLNFGYRPKPTLLLAASSELEALAGIETGIGVSYLF